jgi:hypothetical protein
MPNERPKRYIKLISSLQHLTASHYLQKAPILYSSTLHDQPSIGSKSSQFINLIGQKHITMANHHFSLWKCNSLIYWFLNVSKVQIDVSNFMDYIDYRKTIWGPKCLIKETLVDLITISIYSKTNVTARYTTKIMVYPFFN